MKYFILLMTLLALSSTSFGQDKNLTKLINQVSETSLRKNEYKLASDEFEGRMAASKGDSLSSHLIAAWFQLHHLKHPFQTKYPFYQLVPLAQKIYSNATFSLEGKDYPEYEDWLYLNAPSEIKVENAEVDFIGYGFSTPSFNELNDIDLKSKVLILLFGDNPKDSHGLPLVKEKNVPDIEQRYKGLESKEAAAVFLYDTTSDKFILANKTKFIEADRLISFRSILEEVKTPVYLVSKSLCNELINNRAASVDSLIKLIAFFGKPQSFNTGKKVSLTLNRSIKKRTGQNIIGIIPGTHPSASCIVFTAHHDHEGKTVDGTYYGADDNGSGTTALMEIARILGEASTNGIRPKRSIVFISTDAEEHGMIGSHYYVENPVVPLDKTYCNINIDMLGRVDSFYTGKRTDSNYVYCLFRDTTHKFINIQLLNSLNESYTKLILDSLYDRETINLNPYGLINRSDNYPFMEKGIPSIWFFSGFHKDYHQPTDTPDKINYPLFKKRTQLVLATLWTLANK